MEAVVAYFKVLSQLLSRRNDEDDANPQPG